MKVQIRFRRNLIYLVVLYLSYFIRKILAIIINNIFNLKAPYLFLFMMTIGEMIGGISVYFYQISNWRIKKKIKLFGLKVIELGTDKSTKNDKLPKQILLVFLAGFFDFYAFVSSVFLIPKIADTSPTIGTRLGCLSTMVSFFIYVYAFGFKIGKHHKLCLICLSICFILTFSLEIISKSDDQPYDRFITAQVLICIYLIFIPFNDCIERYLAYYDYLNPFLVLFGEGIFEFIMSIFYSINNDPFRGIINEYEENSKGYFALLIFLLIIHIFLTVIVNAYKVYCNVIYTPMARSLTEYFLNPFTNIYYFVKENDFHQNYLYFFACEIICAVADFSFYVFNDYLILFCCGLEHDTIDFITQRAIEAETHTLEDVEDIKNYGEFEDEGKEYKVYIEMT